MQLRAGQGHGREFETVFLEDAGIDADLQQREIVIGRVGFADP